MYLAVLVSAASSAASAAAKDPSYYISWLISPRIVLYNYLYEALLDSGASKHWSNGYDLRTLYRFCFMVYP